MPDSSRSGARWTRLLTEIVCGGEEQPQPTEVGEWDGLESGYATSPNSNFSLSTNISNSLSVAISQALNNNLFFALSLSTVFLTPLIENVRNKRTKKKIIRPPVVFVLIRH